MIIIFRYKRNTEDVGPSKAKCDLRDDNKDVFKCKSMKKNYRDKDKRKAMEDLCDNPDMTNAFRVGDKAYIFRNGKYWIFNINKDKNEIGQLDSGSHSGKKTWKGWTADNDGFFCYKNQFYMFKDGHYCSWKKDGTTLDVNEPIDKSGHDDDDNSDSANNKGDDSDKNKSDKGKADNSDNGKGGDNNKDKGDEGKGKGDKSGGGSKKKKKKTQTDQDDNDSGGGGSKKKSKKKSIEDDDDDDGSGRQKKKSKKKKSKSQDDDSDGKKGKGNEDDLTRSGVGGIDGQGGQDTYGYNKEYHRKK